MSRQDWLAARKKGIGGSDAAAVLGASRWKTRADVWLDKTGRAVDIEETAPMHWGNMLEPVIRAEYAARTGYTVLQPAMMASEKYPHMLANLDGVANGKRIVEIKTARSADGWGDPGTDEVPLEYAAQVHHYMIVTGMEVADIAVLIGGSDFRIYTVEADRWIHASMVAQEAAFWELVQTDTPPDPVDVREVEALFTRDKGTTVQATEAVYLAAQTLKSAREAIDVLTREKDILEAQIKLALGEAATLAYDGETIATWKAAKDSTVTDWRAAYADLNPPGDHLAPFTHTKPGSRRFLLK